MVQPDAAALPSMLDGSEALLEFLQAELLQLEAVQGCEDGEARGLLLQLRQRTAAMAAIGGSEGGGGSAALTELQLAEQLDSLELQLAQLQASLADTDSATRQLLGQSTSTWLGRDGGSGGGGDRSSSGGGGGDADSTSSSSGGGAGEVAAAADSQQPGGPPGPAAAADSADLPTGAHAPPCCSRGAQRLAAAAGGSGE